MANSRFYSSTAAVTNLQVTAGVSDATIQVASSAGFPGAFPYVLSLDYGSANEELVDVTAGGPSVFNVTRGRDGTSASSHNAGAVVRHVSSARDFTDSRTHEASATGVHGITGQFVDTLSTQTMSNKTLTNPTINAATIAGAVVATTMTLSGGTFSAPAIANAALSGTFTGNPTLSGAVTFTGTVTFTTTAGALFQRAAVANSAIRTAVTGDSVDRLNVEAGGLMHWGPGNAAADTHFGRTGIAQATLTGALIATSTVDITGAVTMGSLTGNVGGSPNFTGQPTFTPLTVSGSTLVPDTVTNGWSLDAAAGRKTAGVTTIRVMVERTGGNIVASASGNIADTRIGTLAAGYRPIDGTMITNYDMSGVATGSVSIGNDGIMTIKSLSAGNTIGLADTVTFSLTWASSI